MAMPPVPFRAESNTQQYTASFPTPIYYRDTLGMQQEQRSDDEEQDSFGSKRKIVPKPDQQRQKPQPSLAYPPPLYYRDTFGIEPVPYNHLQTASMVSDDGGASDHSDETGTTKSTVRHTIRIFHPDASTPAPALNRLLMLGQPRRKQSALSGGAVSDQATAGMGSRQQSVDEMSHSFQVEEMLTTDQVLLSHGRPLLWLATIGFGTALQLLIFAVVCVFFDGHWLGIAMALLLLFHSVLVLLHLRRIRTRPMLLICSLFSGVAFVLSLSLFLGTAYLIHTEDQRIRGVGTELNFSRHFQPAELEQSNQIVQNARMAMYSLQLIYAPIYATCSCALFFLLFRNYTVNRVGRTRKGFFLTRLAPGHQSVLVPIKLRQVNRLDDAHLQVGADGCSVTGLDPQNRETDQPSRVSSRKTKRRRKA